MPNRNGTGPRGQGAMTGRAMGNCFDDAANQNRGPQASGRRCNLGNCADEDTPIPTREILLEQKAFLKNSLAEVEKQLEDFDK